MCVLYEIYKYTKQSGLEEKLPPPKLLPFYPTKIFGQNFDQLWGNTTCFLIFHKAMKSTFICIIRLYRPGLVGVED